jgi:hypothetical protein
VLSRKCNSILGVALRELFFTPQLMEARGKEQSEAKAEGVSVSTRKR